MRKFNPEIFTAGFCSEQTIISQIIKHAGLDTFGLIHLPSHHGPGFVGCHELLVDPVAHNLLCHTVQPANSADRSVVEYLDCLIEIDKAADIRDSDDGMGVIQPVSILRRSC